MATKNKTAAGRQKSKADFGRSYAELEKIIAWFDSGEVDLDEGLKKFEHGLSLAKDCRERLDEVEAKVKEIRGKFG